ncbi:uncharacterized protein A1O9_04707 [Exophiala aquamarina CBS 119918]|uniref:ABM domain-containing protein n=1 Tax=Exophiala aquamarina CBS 119918 TaxID=1182545 RepID=A0A072PID4_9EURO|nr:uncharacterized protein A1O9_04707 [Exophiala aquamarina CBS 119918]KEF59859.1 hypothetical protein A1O9_04707 [Exophiala aquamarina CBS 119918]
MATIPDEILCEILCPRAKAGGKSDVVSNFKTIFAISNQAAASSNFPPPLGLKVFENVNAHPEEAGLFLFWRSMENHDCLSQTPGFKPAAKLFGEKIVPNLETPLQPCYLWTRQGEVALRDANFCEVIEVQISGSEDIEKLGESFPTALDKLNRSEGFRGYFYGPIFGDSSTYVIVVKWNSKADMDDNEGLQDVEKSILGVLGGRSSIVKRHQMYT